MSATPWVPVPAPVLAEMVTGRPWGQDGESLLHRLATATEDAVPAELWPWCVRAARVVSTSGTTVVLHVDDGSAEGVLTCSADGPLIAQVLAVQTGAHVRMLDVQDLGAETRRLLDRPAPRAATVLVVDDGRERMTAWKDDVLAIADDGSLESARRATWDVGVRAALVDAVCGSLRF